MAGVKQIVCESCGDLALRGSAARLCVVCSAKRDEARRAKYVGKNPLSPEEKKARKKAKWAREDALRLRAAQEELQLAQPIAWPANEAPDLLWLVRVAAPFSYKFSKNAQWAMGNRANVFLRKEAMDLRKGLMARIRAAYLNSGVKTVTAKLWVDIFVQKSNNMGDAINVVDSVCDALKEAVELDDRWFSIRKLDWQIVKESPRIYIGFGQETDVPHTACSHCGQVMPSEGNFIKRVSNKSGYSTVCIPCSRFNDSEKRKERLRRKNDEFWSLD